MPASNRAASKPIILRFMTWASFSWGRGGGRGRGEGGVVGLTDHLDDAGAEIRARADLAGGHDPRELAADVGCAALGLLAAREAVLPLGAGEPVAGHAEAGEAGQVVAAVRAGEAVDPVVHGDQHLLALPVGRRAVAGDRVARLVVDPAVGLDRDLAGAGA